MILLCWSSGQGRGEGSALISLSLQLACHPGGQGLRGTMFKEYFPVFIFISRWERSHCEIAGWGMQEYNNTASYPDSVRAARIKVRWEVCLTIFL